MTPIDFDDSSEPTIDLLFPRLAWPKQNKHPSFPLTTEKKKLSYRNIHLQEFLDLELDSDDETMEESKGPASNLDSENAAAAQGN